MLLKQQQKIKQDCRSPRKVLYESDKTLSANSYSLNKGRKCNEVNLG